MKTLLTLFVLLAPMSFANHAFAACMPGPNQVSIFVDSNFGGACVTLGVADYANSNEFGLPNDSVSSIRVGSAAQAFLCRDANFGGTCQTVTSDLASLSNQPIGNDQISSLRVQARGSPTSCVPGASQASFFVDANFMGACVTLDIADYPNSPAIGLDNDSISSIRVGTAAQAFVCRDDNFGGTCQTVTADLSELSNQPIGNDQISSLRVQARGAATNCPPGPNQASFFVDANFSGQCVTLNFGSYPSASAFILPNDSISSIRLGAGTQAFVCRDNNFGGTCQTVTTSLSGLSNQSIGNDQISSIKVQPLGTATNCPPGADQASFFVDRNFSGQCVTLNFGNYPNASAFSLPNDSISSIRMGSATQAYVCQDDNYGGTCQKVTASLAELSNQPIGNDQISSLMVQPLGSATGCIPAANQTSFFVDANFSGQCVTLNLGDYPSASAIGLPNDSISSIRLGVMVQAFVCRDNDFGGTCQTVTGNLAELSGQPIGNDQISSLKVQPLGSITSCTPGANQASFFVDSQFSGSCMTLGIGDYPTPSSVGLPNDSISSIKVGSNAQTFVCRDDHFGGQCQVVTGNVPDLSNQPIGNDQISSLNVRQRGATQTCTPGPNQAAFYVDANFANACVVLNAGSYPTAAVFQLPNDSISSIRLGSQVTVLACRDAQYGGTCQTITNDLASLGNQPIGNDTISSLKVMPRGKTTICAVAWRRNTKLAVMQRFRNHGCIGASADSNGDTSDK